MKRLRFLMFVSLFLSQFAISLVAFAGLEKLPVQDGGRVKPFDTFSREMLQLIWGRENYHDRKAVDVVFSWVVMPPGVDDPWDNAKIVLIRHSGVREALSLSNEQLYYSPHELLGNTKLGLVFQDLKNKREAQEKLNPFYSAVETLENQLTAYHSIRLQQGLRLVPSASTVDLSQPVSQGSLATQKPDSKPWLSTTEMSDADKAQFKKIAEAFIQHVSAETKHDAKDEAEANAAVDSAVQGFVTNVESRFGDYSNRKKISAEVVYNQVHPFRFAWIFYLLSLIFFSFAFFSANNTAMWTKIAWSGVGVAAIFHVSGFLSRVYILDRPPVSNMFETVVWVAFVAVVLSAVLYRLNRSLVVPLASMMVATLSLILCDVSSSVLDSSLMLLQPVLRDNFWLMTHVIIIVSSYAAFFLAFFIGDIVLFYYLRDEKANAKRISEGVTAIYRSIQVGVVLLAAGIILGGIWADYSWGRFWGWDPKETWAFIALLGYIAVLHGRIAGWLRQFGLAAAAVLGFSLVIMSWYGVNFVLGAGLHTYGFGAGGVEYVAGFVAAHILFVAYVITLRQNRLKAMKT